MHYALPVNLISDRWKNCLVTPCVTEGEHVFPWTPVLLASTGTAMHDKPLLICYAKYEVVTYMTSVTSPHPWTKLSSCGLCYSWLSPQGLSSQDKSWVCMKYLRVPFSFCRDPLQGEHAWIHISTGRVQTSSQDDREWVCQNSHCSAHVSHVCSPKTVRQRKTSWSSINASSLSEGYHNPLDEEDKVERNYPFTHASIFSSTFSVSAKKVLMRWLFFQETEVRDKRIYVKMWRWRSDRNLNEKDVYMWEINPSLQKWYCWK